MLFRRLVVVLACAGGPSLAGCDLIDTEGATTVLGATLVQRPAISQVNVQSSVLIADVWVGPTDGEAFGTPALEAAQVTFRLADGRTIDLDLFDAGAGRFTAEVAADVAASLEPGDVVNLEVLINGSVFAVSATVPPPIPSAAIDLSPSPTMFLPSGFEVHPRNTALTVSWAESFSPAGFAMVHRADVTGAILDTRPVSLAEVQALGQGLPAVDIAADVFAEDGLYAVTLFVVEANNNAAPPTDEGSRFFVGTGTALLLSVSGP